MIKKLIAIFACVALISVCFTACGDKKDKAAESGNAAESMKSEQGGNGQNASALTEAYDAERDPYAKDLDDWGITPR